MQLSSRARVGGNLFSMSKFVYLREYGQDKEVIREAAHKRAGVRNTGYREGQGVE